MVIAIAMIKAVTEKEKSAYHALKELNGVKKLYHIFGDYDFFLVVEAGNMDILAQLIKGIRGMSCVAAADAILVGEAGCKEVDKPLVVLA